MPSTDSAADSHDTIEVRGARHNNLADLWVDVPKRRLTVFTGLSGSGKSSLVFGTIAAESQRLINETYTAFLQSFMPSTGRPDVDSLRNLSAAIVVDQERMGTNSRSTVGTATDAAAILRILFSRAGSPRLEPSSAFSFNDSEGMCPECEGLGRTNTMDIDQLIDRELSLNEGAITVPGYAVGNWYWQVFVGSGLLDADKKLRDYTDSEWHTLLHQSATKVKVERHTLTYEGLVPKIERTYLAKDRQKMQKTVREFVDRAVVFARCGPCQGSRLNARARSVRVQGHTIAECAAMQIDDLAAFVRTVAEPSVKPMADNLAHTLDSLAQVGLGYLSLQRESSTLSGGEAQRVKMVRHLGSSLSDLTYVFDEPTAGLHPHDIDRMNGLLLRLRDKGNTVLVVEHKPETIAIADHVVDLGPRAGPDGGHITYTGDVAGLRACPSPTGRHLQHRVRLKERVRRPAGHLAITGANTHNLQDVDVQMPLGVLTAVTGVAGSGKSSLIHGSLPGREGVVVVDQSAIKGSRRSNPATYTGLLDAIRSAFARANGVKASLFSANSEGACGQCKGAGVLYTDLAMMAGVASTCQKCQGKRFRAEVLAHTLGGLDISQVLAMSVVGAREFFTRGRARTVLERLHDVGLGYLSLGQPLSTLSGGERQRLKLAISMARAGAVYVLDEPTSGLHLADVDRLLALLDRLVEDGNTVVVIEHHQAVMAHADHLIDLGPGAGHEGGRVVFQGSPAELVEHGQSLTAHHLRTYLGR